MRKLLGEVGDGPDWAWWFALLFVVSGCALGFSNELTPFGKSLMAWVMWGCIVAFLAPSTYLAGKKGHAKVPYVCTVVLILLFAFVVAFIYWYMKWIPSVPTLAHDRILNVIPVVTAVVAASLGWYVHYQYTAKAHRTNHAFSIVMEMRKSSEFLRKQEQVARHFPVGVASIPAEYVDYFPATSLKRLHDEARAKSEAPGEIEMERASAVAALKYVLNFYEFMAAGVMANDLDKNHLFETVSDIVVGVYDRSTSLIDYIRRPKEQGGQGQTYAFENLAKLVEEFREMDEAKVLKERTDAAKNKSGR